MSQIINLNRARKEKARRAARAKADANAALHGIPKAERGLADARRAVDAARHEAHRRDAPQDPQDPRE